jgi:hypothetical protein
MHFFTRHYIILVMICPELHYVCSKVRAVIIKHPYVVQITFV